MKLLISLLYYAKGIRFPYEVREAKWEKPVNIRIAFFFVSQIVFVTGQGQHKISILFA